MPNDPLQELRYILAVLEYTRTGQTVDSPENVRDVLEMAGYSVPLKKVEEVQKNLEWLIPRPWMAPQRIGQGIVVVRSYAIVADRIKKNKLPQKPAAPLLLKLYEQFVTPPELKRVDWERATQRFLENPFTSNIKIASTLRAIREALKPESASPLSALSRGGREIRNQMERQPALRKQLLDGLRAREQFNRTMRIRQMLRGRAREETYELKAQGNPTQRQDHEKRLAEWREREQRARGLTGGVVSRYRRKRGR